MPGLKDVILFSNEWATPDPSYLGMTGGGRVGGITKGAWEMTETLETTAYLLINFLALSPYTFFSTTSLNPKP